jgi:hypothetical protein
MPTRWSGAGGCVAGARIGLVLLLAAVAGCSSKSSGSPSNNEVDASGAEASAPADATADAVQSAEDSSSSDHSSPSGDQEEASSDAAHSSKDATADGATADGATVDAGDAPAGQTGAAAYCSAICSREAFCIDAGPDAGCQCETGSLSLYRSDYVASLAACESSVSCTELLESDGGSADSGVQGCADAVLAQVTPTAAVTSFCAQVGNSNCTQDAITDCPDQIKVYSNVTVAALASCIADPTCGDHTACLTTALTP